MRLPLHERLAASKSLGLTLIREVICAVRRDTTVDAGAESGDGVNIQVFLYQWEIVFRRIANDADCPAIRVHI